MSTGAIVNQKVSSASGVTYDNSSTSSIITGTNVQSAIDQLFTSVSNGKSSLASAITDKGVSTSATDSFATMANNISSISVLNVPHISITFDDSSTIQYMYIDYLDATTGKWATYTHTTSMSTGPNITFTIPLYTWFHVYYNYSRMNDHITINTTGYKILTGGRLSNQSSDYYPVIVAST